MTAHIRRKTPERKTIERKAAKHRATPVQETADQRLLDLERMEQYRQEIGQTWQAITVSYPLRQTTPQAWKDWQEAVCRHYEVYKKYAALYFRPKPLSDEAARYNWDFWRDIELLRGGDASKLESAMAFLESDPWFHGSGYAKVKMIRHIKPAMLTPSYTLRLQQVVLDMVERRNGQDFRAYCRLARKVDAPELREQLTRRLTHSAPNVRRRAKWVLEALEQNQPQEKSN